jgi:hypothetical protein
MKKYFGIGLSKTGTTSLTEALNILGFNIIHNPTKNELFNSNNNSRNTRNLPGRQKITVTRNCWSSSGSS